MPMKMEFRKKTPWMIATIILAVATFTLSMIMIFAMTPKQKSVVEEYQILSDQKGFATPTASGVPDHSSSQVAFKLRNQGVVPVTKELLDAYCEFMFMEGQSSYMKGDIRIRQVGDDFIWIKDPWDNLPGQKAFNNYNGYKTIFY